MCRLDTWRNALKHPSSWTKSEMRAKVKKLEPICRKKSEAELSAIYHGDIDGDLEGYDGA